MWKMNPTCRIMCPDFFLALENNVRTFPAHPLATPPFKELRNSKKLKWIEAELEYPYIAIVYMGLILALFTFSTHKTFFCFVFGLVNVWYVSRYLIVKILGEKYLRTFRRKKQWWLKWHFFSCNELKLWYLFILFINLNE